MVTDREAHNIGYALGLAAGAWLAEQDHPHAALRNAGLWYEQKVPQWGRAIPSQQYKSELLGRWPEDREPPPYEKHKWATDAAGAMAFADKVNGRIARTLPRGPPEAVASTFAARKRAESELEKRLREEPLLTDAVRTAKDEPWR